MKTIGRVALSASLLALGTGAFNAQAQTSHSLAVSSSGQPNYRFPIAVPPGVGGLSPKLSLSYEGNKSVSGPLGVGWGIGGVSAIGRCNAFPKPDGYRSGINFQASDKLCLDGARLIKVNSSGPMLGAAANDAHGAAAGVYYEFRTESDIYARIRAYGMLNASDVNGGPMYFKVWTKSGHVLEFGDGSGSDANTNATVRASHRKGESAFAQTWLLSQTTDISGNLVKFKYSERNLQWGTDLNTTDGPGHEWNLSEVQYSGNKVVFAYADRAPGSPQDANESYHQGSKNVSVRRLASVTTYINSPNPTVLGPAAAAVAVRTFKLSYDKGPNTGRSRLTSIKECAGAVTSTECLPATTFDYADGANEAFQYSTAFSLPNHNHRVVNDFNGDGRSDILLFGYSGFTSRLYFGNPDGSLTQSSSYNLAGEVLTNTGYQTGYPDGGCIMLFTPDVNGDGLPDLLSVWMCTNAPSSPYAPQMYLNSGNGSFVESPLSSNAVAVLYFKGLSCSIGGNTKNCQELHNFTLTDVNGDRKVDLVVSDLPDTSFADDIGVWPNPCATTVCTRVFKGNGDGTFAQITTNLANYNILSVGPGAASLLDYDLDTFTDIAPRFEMGWSEAGEMHTQRDVLLARSRGNGDFDMLPAKTCGTFSPHKYGSGIDYNGDGRMDCIDLGETNHKLYVAHDAKNVPMKLVSNFNLATLARDYDWQTFGIHDFNGDGRSDLAKFVMYENTPSTYTNEVWLSNGDATFNKSSTFNMPSAVIGLSEGIDIMGTGQLQLLTYEFVTGYNGIAARLVVKSTASVPPDTLLSMTSPTGATTTLTYVSLARPSISSDSLGPRYFTDLRTSFQATSPDVMDVTPAMYVVATVASSDGKGGVLKTEYQYRGLKADTTGRGSLGFREIASQSPGADGNPLTTVTSYQQGMPYTSYVAKQLVYAGTLVSRPEPPLSSITYSLCDFASTSAEQLAASTSGAPCTTVAAIKRPYVKRMVQTATDLSGAVLPTVTTETSINATGDTLEQEVTHTLSGSADVFTSMRTKTYAASDTTCADFDTCNWIIGRVQTDTAHNTVPATTRPTSAGTGPRATANVGSFVFQASTLSAVSFGVVDVAGSAVIRTSTLSNTGLNALAVTTPSAASVSGTDFAFSSTNCPASLAPGATCTVSVSFNPTAAVARSGVLSLSTSGGVETAALSGTGGAPVLAFSSTGVAFGTTAVNSVTNSATVTLSNSGTRAASPPTFTAPAGFSVQASTCSSVLAVGSSCSFVVRFAPAALQAYSGNVTATANGVSDTLAVSGTGGSVALAFSPASIAFGTRATTTLNTSSAVTLANSGTAAVSSLALAAPAGYSLLSNTCGASLAPGASCTFSVRFAPTAVQPYNGNVTATFNGGVASQALTGAGASVVLATSPTSLAFGAETVGTAENSASVTLTNSGTMSAAALALAPPAGYSIASSTCSTALAAGASCTFVVRFAPTAAQAYAGSVSISAVGDTAAVALSGSGVAAAVVTTAAFPVTHMSAGSTTSFSWSTTGATSATVSCTGKVTASGSGTSGALSVPANTATQTGTGTCTVTALNAAGDAVTRSDSVTLVPRPTVAASFSPTTVAGGGSATLSWSTTGATAVSYSCAAPAVGSSNPAAASGSATISTSGTGSGRCTVTARNAANTAVSDPADLLVLSLFTVTGPSSSTWTFTNPNSVAVAPSVVDLTGTGFYGPMTSLSSSTTCKEGVAVAAGGTCTVVVVARNPACSMENYTVRPVITQPLGTTTGQPLAKNGSGICP